MQRPIGVNTWVWCSPPTDQILSDLIPRIAGWGFDIVEIPVEEPDQWSPDLVRGLLGEHGLGATVCLVMPPGRELVATDDHTVATTEAYLKHVVDVAAAVGSSVIAGPAYSSVGRTWLLDPDERRRAYDELATHLRPIASHAADSGVRIAIEPLNRFETSLVNTVEQALEIVQRLDHDSVGIAVDTFHAAIEERDVAAGIMRAGTTWTGAVSSTRSTPSTIAARCASSRSPARTRRSLERQPSGGRSPRVRISSRPMGSRSSGS